ncbi:DUF3089 domain-containing protein [Sphingomicrobium sediminis]|uniref:DUF3089 domain-containing protein n=1 Tax=Sphingomicrobium sediminis TaxID=2950949 RepID=A0A9X2EEX1_9SPHN|nr:DUF3089 domain-containing protein [Sphingomicrobium sediminis]MCM8556695.1 DUF3089 domain-containing protein [Sphingomicrobium sediminis]
MAARIFLYIIAGITLLIVGGAFIFYLYGDRVLAEQAMPKVEFTAPPPEEAPLYADIDSWWTRPDRSPNLADWEPEPAPVMQDTPMIAESGEATDEVAAPASTPAAPEMTRNRPVAVFFIHPTTYLKTDRWNAEMDLEGFERTRTELFVKSQASVFAELGRVWTPKYRQAAFGAFLSQEPDAQAALGVAYEDLQAAFDIFLEQNPVGPIIVAGHSQGGLHALHLLADYREQLAGRLLAAYVVGWPIDMEADLPATGLPACSTRNEAACLMSWLTFGDPPNAGLVLREWLTAEGYEGIERDRERLVCTNPLTGGEDREAMPIENPGLLIPEDDLESAVLLPGSVGARCERGLLLLNGEIPELGPYVLPGNNYHVYDYALFWGAIREDVAARFDAWPQ